MLTSVAIFGKMLRQNVPKSKSIISFCINTVDGQNQRFVYEELQRDQLEEFLNFYINYHAKEAPVHKISGLYKSPQALAEYKQILREKLADPSYIMFVCRPQNSDKIVSISSVKLVGKQDVEKNYVQMAKTPELKLHLNILKKLKALCSNSEVMSKYGVDTMFDDHGSTVRPDYRGFGIHYQNCMLRIELCKIYGVPLIGVWATSPATQKVVEKNGCETLKAFSKNDLEQALGVKFDSDIDCFKYVVWMNKWNC